MTAPSATRPAEASDVCRLVQLIDVVADAEANDIFYPGVMEGLATFIPCDVMVFEVVDTQRGIVDRLRLSSGVSTQERVVGAGMPAEPVSEVGEPSLHVLTVALPPLGALDRRLTLTRRSAPFSEYEQAVARLLRPHLANLHERRLRELNGAANLTERQRQILRMVAAGSSNTQIARRLHVSEGTVRKHLENIFVRLHVGSRTEAVTSAGAHLG